jgi:SAM-dependent methyltransferase
MRCDACGSPGGDALFEGGDRRFGLPGRFSVVRCPRCLLVRTEPQPDDLGVHYPSDDYYSFARPEPPKERVRERVRAAYDSNGSAAGARQRLAAAGRDRLMPGMPPGPPGDILDVGCGSGSFLLALREAGWRPHGIELSDRAVAAAHEAGLDTVRRGDLLDADYRAQSFDVVRFWHSLEHMRSPRAQLTEALRLLRPGGRLTVGVPNFGSLISRSAGERWYYLDLPRHLWHFEAGTLARLVARCGFLDPHVRQVSGGIPLLGTLDYLRGRRERLVKKRWAWYAALPAAALLDRAGVGDALTLTASAPAAERSPAGALHAG